MVEHTATASTALEEALEHEQTSTGQSHRKVMMWAFLGSDCMFFGSLIGTFLVYQNNAAAPHTRPEVLGSLGLVSLMAFVLLVSSFTMVLALASARKGDKDMMGFWLLITAMWGLFFVGSQGYEYYQFVQEGLTPRTNLFGASFMALTSFHGAHVSVGVVWLISIVLMVRLRPDQPLLSPWLRSVMASLATAMATALVVTILQKEVGWIVALLAALGIGPAFGGLVWALTSLPYFTRIPAPGIHGPQQSIMATMLPRLLAFLTAAPSRAPGQPLEARPRHRRFLAFVRGQREPTPPPSPDPAGVALHEHEELRVSEEKILNVELGGLYWHFVDVVWVVIFTVVYLLQ